MLTVSDVLVSELIFVGEALKQPLNFITHISALVDVVFSVRVQLANGLIVVETSDSIKVHLRA